MENIAEHIAVALVGLVAVVMVRITIFGPLSINSTPIPSLWMAPFAVAQIWATVTLWRHRT